MIKFPVTAQQRANAIEARDVMWPSVPIQNVVKRLGTWREGRTLDAQTPPDCGTVACFGGWCAWWPAYRNQGILADSVGAPVTKYGDWASAASWQLFGDPTLFSARGACHSDRDFKGSDHALVTNRLNWLIRNSKVKK